VFRFFYNLLFHVGYLLMMPRFLWRMHKRGGYRADFGERMFRLSEEKRKRLSEGRKIWIHAVSVGEFGVADAFMREWRTRHPEAGFVVTVNTSTGHRLAETALTGRDVLLYPPVDSPPVVRRALETLRPQALVLVETELWPNLLWECERQEVPVMLLNGRLSDRSFRRLEKVKGIPQRIYPLVDRFCMQSEEDADRMKRLGAPPDRIRVFHSAKYDGLQREEEAEAERWNRLRSAGFLEEGDRVILGSSTWPGEEGMLVEAFLELRNTVDGLRLILVPRHAERREEILRELNRLEVRTACWSSANDGELGEADVLMVDTTGELKHFTGLADRVVIGKSFFRSEGQNPLEAAHAGKWILTGPGMDNFRAVIRDLSDAEAVTRVNSPSDVASVLRASFDQVETALEQGRRAQALVEARKGSLARSADELEALLNRSGAA
jgi:3-deoxy-D-manno-octulosonic-acid transferase